MEPENIVDKIYEALADSPITLYKLCRRTKLHPNTVKRYVKLIQNIRTKEDIELERKDFRVMIRKKKALATKLQ